MFWRWKSRPGRPPIPVDLQALIHHMASENPSWGEERIANELVLKLGLRVSPRTIRKYMPKRLNHRRQPRVSSQRWQTFVRNHTQAIIACDFCVVVTATLFAGLGSAVVELTVAAFVITVPASVAGLTRTIRVKVAVAPLGNDAVRHDTVPTPPAAGVVQVQPQLRATSRRSCGPAADHRGRRARQWLGRRCRP